LSDARRERADAVRNRHAILAATEELLATNRPGDISIEQVASHAGVGKGTVFRRFTSRTGLMHALMEERARTLEEAVLAGGPPLGEGAPARVRLLAFLDAVIELRARNRSLMTEFAASAAGEPASKSHTPDGRGAHPVYRFWHGHICALIAAERADADADLLAHLILGAMFSEPSLNQLTAEGPERLTSVLHTMVGAILEPTPVIVAPDTSTS
jgi:AcrR family transcriptional regulator